MCVCLCPENRPTPTACDQSRCGHTASCSSESTGRPGRGGTAPVRALPCSGHRRRRSAPRAVVSDANAGGRTTRPRERERERERECRDMPAHAFAIDRFDLISRHNCNSCPLQLLSLAPSSVCFPKETQLGFPRSIGSESGAQLLFDEQAPSCQAHAESLFFFT